MICGVPASLTTVLAAIWAFCACGTVVGLYVATETSTSKLFILCMKVRWWPDSLGEASYANSCFLQYSNVQELTLVLKGSEQGRNGLLDHRTHAVFLGQCHWCSKPITCSMSYRARHPGSRCYARRPKTDIGQDRGTAKIQKWHLGPDRRRAITVLFNFSYLIWGGKFKIFKGVELEASCCKQN